MKNILPIVCILVLILVEVATAQTTQSEPDFTTVVQDNFTQWNGNGDGVLSKEEIYTDAANPNIKGPAAAAVATLVYYVRNKDFSLPPITKEYLLAAANHDSRQKIGQGEVDENAIGSGTKQPIFKKTYLKYLRKINLTSRQLFPQGLPIFNAVHQGALGDCPFVSTVGALVYRNPASIKSMFEERDNGTIVIHFGDGKKMKIHNVTDVDIAIWSSAGTNGLWLTALEKAYRTALVATEHPNPSGRPNIFDKFGSSLLTIEILDGYETEKIPLGKGDLGNLKLKQLRTKLESAVTEKRIVKSGTSGDVHTRGITRGHAYAVVGYDKVKDVVQVWNPHGQEFKPDGAEGLENGYETKLGMFFVPLKEFVQIFADVNIETKVRTQK